MIEITPEQMDRLNRECIWEYDDDGCWAASCDTDRSKTFYFTDDGPKENGFKFCPYCGKPLQCVIAPD